MATNDFKPFATGAGANVMSQADYLALAALLTGFQSGKASSAQVNKALRQATFIASALAQFVSDKSGADVLDDGDLAGFVTKLTNGFGKQYLSRANPFADIKADGTASTARNNLSLGSAALLSAVTAVQGVSGYVIIPGLVGGVEKNTIIQWGAWTNDATGDSTVVFPFPFPNNARQLFVSAQAIGTGAYAGWNTLTKTGFKGNMWASVNTRQSGNSTYLAIGD